jgi:hypothetical protein
MGQAVACIGMPRNAYTVLIMKSELKGLLGRWENDIKMDFRETGCIGVDWIYLAQGRDH